MNNSQLPLARKENLVIQEMPDEVLVYDLDTNKAHCLNQTAAFVWKACDGNNNISDISKLFTQQENKHIDDDLIWLAIDQLTQKELLQNEIVAPMSGETRRSVIKKIGLAAVIALPVVASLTAPTSALARASCGCSTPPLANPKGQRDPKGQRGGSSVGAVPEPCGRGCTGNCSNGVPVNCQ